MNNLEELDIEIPKNIKWDILVLDDVKSPEKRSIISGPFGSNISSKYFTKTGVPVIRGNNLSNNLGVKFRDSGFVFISHEKADELNSWAIKDDLLFTAAGTIGQVGILTGKELFDKYTISNKQLRVRLNKNIINPYYAYYWFASPAIVDIIIQRDTGSTIPLINLGVLKSLPILLPPLLEQERIAEVLSSLDDKIDLLQRNNKTLEQLAETLFRQWLSKLNDRESTTLREYIRVQNGYAFKSNDFKDIGNNSILKITNISFEQVDIHNTQYVDNAVVAGLSEKFIAKPKSFLIAMTGAEIGKIGIIGKTNKKLYINQRVGMLIDILEYSSLLGYLFLKSAEGQDHIINTCSGSAQENISAVGIESMIVPKSSAEEVTILCKNINPLFEKIIYNIEQIQQLETLRDTLLPKLMSGVVRVEN
jgi:type I restriction enzyme S subunit